MGKEDNKSIEHREEKLPALKTTGYLALVAIGMLFAGQIRYNIFSKIKLPFSIPKKMEKNFDCSDLSLVTDRLKLNKYESLIECKKDLESLFKLLEDFQNLDIESDCIILQELKDIKVSELCK